MAKYGWQTPFPQAPEICVEVILPSTTREEMSEKMQFYFEAEAHEVWLYAETGHLSFYTPTGSAEHSRLFPDFPSLFTL